MNLPDVSNLNYTELGELRTIVNDKMKEMRDIGITQLRATIAEQASILQVDIADLMPKKGTKIGSVVAKYRDPENPSKTWSGRGQRPGWLKDALAEGRDLSEFAA